MSDFAARLAALKESSNHNTASEIKTATPFITFLTAYLKSRDESYKEYMMGARCLYKYLSPIDIPEACGIVPSTGALSLFNDYEVEELAKIVCKFNLLGKNEYERAKALSELHYIINLIKYTTCKIILGETNV